MNAPLDGHQWPPPRDLPQVEWSAALSPGAATSGRWVEYGLSETAVNGYLQSRGCDARRQLGNLMEEFGPPAQVAVGEDGRRTKVYWFLDGEDPGFVGLDLVEGEPTGLKHYRGLGAGEGETAHALLPQSLRPHLRWLQDEFAAAGLQVFHYVALSRERPPRYSGVHVGFEPDWEGLVRGQPELLRRPLVEALMDRLGLSAELRQCEGWLFAPEMAWTAYVSLLVRPGDAVGANVYVRASPVLRRDGKVFLIEPGRGGVRPRPLCVQPTLASHPDLEVRIVADEPGEEAFIRLAGWRLDYAASGDATRALVADGALGELEEGLARAARVAGPDDPCGLADALRENPAFSAVRLGPDMR